MGTAAELIKIFPLIDAAERQGIPWVLWSTGQGLDNFWMQYDDFRLPREKSFCLDGKAKDLHSSVQAILWMMRNIFRSKASLLKGIRAAVNFTPQSSDMAIVHGDTFSTFLGARYAKRLGMKLAHVEAGMRSGDIFSPFPEELNRRMVSRWADLHFAPDEIAATHLRQEKQKGSIYVTGGNTVYDSMLSTLKLPPPAHLPEGKYALANLHRFENLQNENRWKALIQALLKSQKVIPTYFVMHPPAEARLNQDSAAKKNLAEAGVQLLGRQSYTHFVHLLASAYYVLTDGGSNQTECAYLGLPCLVMREKTELADGLGKNCVLSKFEEASVDAFFRSPQTLRHSRLQLQQSPSQQIMQVLTEESCR